MAAAVARSAILTTLAQPAARNPRSAGRVGNKGCVAGLAAGLPRAAMATSPAVCQVSRLGAGGGGEVRAWSVSPRGLRVPGAEQGSPIDKRSAFAGPLALDQ